MDTLDIVLIVVAHIAIGLGIFLYLFSERNDSNRRD